MGSRLGHAEAFPKRAEATQCLVPYSENKGYASNPRRFHGTGNSLLTIHGYNSGRYTEVSNYFPFMKDLIFFTILPS